MIINKFDALAIVLFQSYFHFYGHLVIDIITITFCHALREGEGRHLLKALKIKGGFNNTDQAIYYKITLDGVLFGNPAPASSITKKKLQVKKVLH